MSLGLARSTTLATFVLAALALASPAGAQPQPPTTDTSRGLSIRYADGRTMTSPVRRSGGMWTPRFPRMPGVDTSRNGLPLATLDVRHAVDALMWWQFKAYRGERLTLSGRSRGKRNGPLVLPGGEHAFDIATSAGGGPEAADGPDQWQALDRIDVTSLMWQDGVVEGDAGPVAEQHTVDQRRAEHLGRVVRRLRAALSRSIDGLRQQLEDIQAPDAETRQLRGATLEALNGFLASGTTPDAPAFRAWLSRASTEYEEWLARIASPTAETVAR